MYICKRIGINNHHIFTPLNALLTQVFKTFTKNYILSSVNTCVIEFFVNVNSSLIIGQFFFAFVNNEMPLVVYDYLEVKPQI